MADYRNAKFTLRSSLRNTYPLELAQEIPMDLLALGGVWIGASLVAVGFALAKTFLPHR